MLVSATVVDPFTVRLVFDRPVIFNAGSAGWFSSGVSQAEDAGSGPSSVSLDVSMSDSVAAGDPFAFDGSLLDADFTPPGVAGNKDGVLG